MRIDKPETTPAHANSMAAEHAQKKRGGQADPMTPEGVLHRKGAQLERASDGASNRGTTERLVNLLDPDNIGRGLAKQGAVDLTSGMKSSLKQGSATQSQPTAGNSEKAGTSNAQHMSPTPTAKDGSSRPDTPFASANGDTPQADAKHAELASSAPRHSTEKTETPQAAKSENQTPSATDGNRTLGAPSKPVPAETARVDTQPAAMDSSTPRNNAQHSRQQADTPRADAPADKPIGSIATAPTEANAPMAPAQPAKTAQLAQTASQASAPEYTPPSAAVPQGLPSTEATSPLAVASAETRTPDSATQGQPPYEQKTTSRPSGTQQAGGPSLAELLETLDKEWRQDIATSANDSAARSGPDTQPGVQPEVVRQYADSITALLQSPPTPFTANNGHPSAVAENARREAFDREVTERLKRVLAAGPNAASRVSQTDITAIHAESLRRELVDNGVLAPNEDLPDASQQA